MRRGRAGRPRGPLGLWAIGTLYGALALLSTFLDGSRWYVADNRFEQYYNPARSLAKMFSIWDGSRGLGGPREDVWLGTTIPVALARGLGFSPAHTERIWHSACLVIAGLGVVVLTRLFRRPLGPEHVLAGLLVMFGPYSASFIVPSNLYFMFAISPWLLIVFIRGVSEDRPWRWAAVFALLVMWAGNSDTPGLLYVAVAMASVSMYIVIVERAARWRDIASWLAKAGGLALACSAWILVKTYYAAEALDARLADTELPSASATTSSWSESLRGLGNWLSYFREEGRLLKPQTTDYFEHQWVVAATFVMPVIALVVVWRSQWRGRLLFGALAVGAVVVMVGGFGSPHASPLGEGILALLERDAFFEAFRNTYKAGSGLVIGVAVLSSVGAVDAFRWCRSRVPKWSLVAGAGGCVVLIGVSLPFATASSYHPYLRVADIPSYWSQAFGYLDQLPVDGRSLIVPAISQTEYRWGYVGDDIFDALLTRPHATATGWMLSTRTGHNALETITLWAQDSHYQPGVLGPMARRLGITEIVLRNDVDWRRANVARPASHRGLRSDPDFEMVAAFGRPGSTVFSDLDLSAEVKYEKTLPPVEIYRLRNPFGLLDVQPSNPADTLVVAGDAHAWPQLALAGLLGESTAIVASGGLTTEQLTRTLNDGAAVVVTDTARRRVRTLLRHEPQLSPTLSVDQELDRPVRPVYPDTPGAESVAWYRDATSIIGAYVRLGGVRNDRRASLAFDEDPATAWVIPWSGIGPAPSITVSLREQHTMHRISVRSTFTPQGVATVTAITLGFADGTTTPIKLGADGWADTEFPERRSDEVTVTISGIGVFGSDVGLADVSIGELDLVEYIQSPSELSASTDPAIEAALQTAPTAYTFGRVTQPVSAVRESRTSSIFDEEVSMRRRFHVVREDELALAGYLRLVATTSDTALATLLGGAVSAVSDRSHLGSDRAQAAYVLDGDVATWWSADAHVGESLTIHVPRQRLSSVVITEPSDDLTARVTRVQVVAGGTTAQGFFGPSQCTVTDRRVCTRVARIKLPAGVVDDTVVLRIAGIDIKYLVAADSTQVRLSEVTVVGEHDNALDRSAPVSGECVDLGLRLQPDASEPRTVLVRAVGTVGDVLDREHLAFSACDTYSAVAGEQVLNTGAASMFDEIALVPVGGLGHTAQNDRLAVAYHAVSSDRIDAEIDATGPVTVTLRTSFDPRWRLSIDGSEVPAELRDGGNSWDLEVDGPTSIRLDYAPSSIFRLALAFSIIATGVCLAVALGPRRRSPSAALTDPSNGWLLEADAPRQSARTGRGLDVLIIASASLLGVVLVGPWAVAIAVVTVALISWLPTARQSLGMAPPVLLTLAAISSVLVNPGAYVGITYATERLQANGLAALAVVFLLQVIGLAAVDARRSEARPVRPRPLRGWRPPDRPRISRYRTTVALAATIAAIAAWWLGELMMPGALVVNLRLGTEYTAMPLHGPPALDISPLPAMLAAWAPVPVSWLAAAAAVVSVLSAAVLARRWSGQLAGMVAAAVMAGLTVVWIHGVPALIASAAAAAAVVVANIRPVDLRVACASGVLVAAATLSQPGAILVALVVAVLWQRAAASRAPRIAAGLVVVLLVVPWYAFGWAENGFPHLGGDYTALGWMAGLLAALIGVVVQRAGAARQRRRHADATE